MATELYKITSINDDGIPIEVYAVSPHQTFTYKTMISEYGNAEIEQIDVDDAPEEIRENLLTSEE